MHVQFIVYVKIVLKSLNISNVFMNETFVRVSLHPESRSRNGVSSAARYAFNSFF